MINSKADDISKHYDGRFSWFVAFCSFLAHIVLSFNMVCFGLLLPEFTEYFDKPQSIIGFIGASRVGIVYLGGTFGGGLTHMYGCRCVAVAGFILAGLGNLAGAFVDNIGTFMLTFGVIAGIGAGLAYIPLTVILQHYFLRRRASATGLATAGLSAGSVILGSISGELIYHLTWRGYLSLLACVNIQCLVAVVFFFPVPQLRTNQPQTAQLDYIEDKEDILSKDTGNTDAISVRERKCKTTVFLTTIFDVSLFSNKRFLVFALAYVLISMSFSGYYLLAPNRAVVQGVDKLFIGFIVTAIGCMSFAGRISSGIIADQKCSNITMQFCVGVGCASLVMSLSTLAGGSLAIHIVFAAAMGFSLGSYEGIHAIFLVRLLGSSRLPQAMSWVQCMRGVSALITLPLAGWLFDFTGGYRTPYLVIASLVMAGSLANLSAYFMVRRKEHMPDLPKQKVTDSDIA